MFQSFQDPSEPAKGPKRLAALRAELTKAGLDGFIVPRADAHQGETVSERDERLRWLTGFTGSAGFAIALMDRAGVFVDGRYRVQIKQQVDLASYTPVDWPETKPATWLAAALPDGGTIGYDAWLHTSGEIEAIEKGLSGTGITLKAVDNLVDQVWTDRPAPPAAKMVPYPMEFAGKSSADKRAEVAKTLRDAGHDAAALNLPESVAWLLNIRGADLERLPVALCFAIVHGDGRVDVFTDPAKAVDLDLDDGVTIHDFADFAPALSALSGTVRVDKKSAPKAFSDILKLAGTAVAFADDPCALPKACKNPTEISGTREAHLRDAAAMVQFLAWFDATAPRGGVTEIDVVTALEGFRRGSNALQDISFDTIAGSGPNGALAHYRVSEAGNRTLETGDLIVVDSGGQYFDGTTDITRTIPIGPPGDDECHAFTRVLQGMIALSRIRWPKGVTGAHLDVLARAQLWMAGQDYDHGTGHGVGHYLSVHEGPARISRLSDVPLQPGMILSNEPGYYREGAFGIRTENLLVVREADPVPGGDDRPMLDFETLVFVPIDRRLIVTQMLTAAERDWLNAYHAEVLTKVGPRIDGDALDWLEQACAPM